MTTDLRLLVEDHKEAIKAAVSRHRGRRVAVFGSVARGDATEESDVDFLVEFEAGSSLLDLLRMQDELSEMLGRRVDVVSLGGLKPRDEHPRGGSAAVTRDDEQRIADMLEVADQIAELVQRGRAAFGSDIAVRFAIERLLEILGEAANSVSTATRERFPDVAWLDVSRLRIVLAHHYHRVDPDQVWSMATQEVPALAEGLRSGGPAA